MIEVSISVAFIAGIISFLSPCVLPIIPGFLAYLSGSSLQGSLDKKERLAIFMNSVFFVLGFSVVFAVLGVLLNTVLENVAYDAQVWLARLGGVLVIFFGLYLARLIRIPFLERDFKVRVRTRFNSRYLTSFVFGSAFAAGWTPCVGAALGAILGLAVLQPGTALYLLFAYSLGLGVPFLLMGLFASQASGFIAKYSETFKYINIAFGIILVILGVLVFTQSLNLVASFGFVNNFILGN